MNVLAARLFHWPSTINFEAPFYLAASVIALAVDMGSFSALMRLVGVSWFWASASGFVMGAVVAYLLSIHWVFATRRLKTAPQTELAIFIGIGLAGICLTQILLWIGIEWLHALPELVKLAAAGVTFMFNYTVRKTVLFSDTQAAAR